MEVRVEEWGGKAVSLRGRPPLHSLNCGVFLLSVHLEDRCCVIVLAFVVRAFNGDRCEGGLSCVVIHAGDANGAIFLRLYVQGGRVGVGVFFGALRCFLGYNLFRFRFSIGP